jgi:RNA 2',3'-cyclic 3'-phosphodiesterase
VLVRRNESSSFASEPPRDFVLKYFPVDNLKPAQVDSPLNRKVRAFLAIGPPPEEWLDALDNWLIPLKRRLTASWPSLKPPIAWTKREHLHVTLRFFGNVSVENLMLIKEVVSLLTSTIVPMSLTFEDLVFFPNRRQARIAALQLKAEGLEKLVTVARDGLRNIGQPPENRPFIPHVTLARLKPMSGMERLKMKNLWPESSRPELPIWPVTEITLIQSQLSPGGSIYTPIGIFPLTGKSAEAGDFAN